MKGKKEKKYSKQEKKEKTYEFKIICKGKQISEKKGKKKKNT